MDELEKNSTVELIVRAVRNGTCNCLLLDGNDVVSLKTKEAWKAVPGEIISVRVSKHWEHRKYQYLSGKIESIRLDIEALNLTPLKLEQYGTFDPSDYDWDEEDEHIVELGNLGKHILTEEKRPEFRLEEFGKVDDEHTFNDLLFEAVDLRETGEAAGADDIVMKLLQADLRYLDAHAHLGTSVFDSNPKLAIRHYEVGVRIGERSLDDSFKGILPWSCVDNRPFFRCMHGYGLCLWRLEKDEEAKQIFERMIQLNPNDNQGVRYLLHHINNKGTWEDCRD